VCAACLKNLVRIFVEKIYKMGFLEGSSVPILNIGRTVPKG
jgi:Fe2+ transport system protein FeoA